MTDRTARKAPPPRFRETSEHPPEPAAAADEWRATLKMPRSAAAMFDDVDEAHGLAWALVSVLEPSIEAGLQAPYVKGALEVAYCALERMERLHKDIARLTDDEDVQMRAYIRAGGAA